MLSYCLKYRKKQRVKTRELEKQKRKTNVFIKIWSLWVCGLLNSLGIKTPLTKIPLVGPFCFKGTKWIKL